MKDNESGLSVGDTQSLIKEANHLLASKTNASGRRHFIRQGLTLGGLVMLTGCDISSNPDIENVLSRVSGFNDRIQSWLFSSERLSPEYSQEDVVRPFPFNAYYSEADIPTINGDGYRLELRGRIRDKRSWSLPELYGLVQHEQITRHICVEGWSAIGRWGGVRLSDFFKLTGADTRARYVSFRCADDYYTSIDMASALHPQTILALSWDGRILPAEYGYPMKLRIPTKLGYKNPKHIISIEVTDRYTGGYWEDQGYNWFGGS